MSRVVRKKFRQPVDRTEVATDWAARGYSCGMFVDPPGQQWNNFVHATDELVVICEGNVRMIVAGESLDMSPGDEVFIPRGAEHSVHNIHPGQSSWLYGYNKGILLW